MEDGNVNQFTTGALVPPRWKGMHPDTIGRLVAFILRRLDHVTSVEITRDALRVTVKGNVFPPELEEQVNAVANAPLAECPCGCRADMLLGSCYREAAASWRVGVDLNEGERSLVRAGNWIGGIKSYRDRVRCGLKEAKEAVDAYRAQMNGGVPVQ